MSVQPLSEPQSENLARIDELARLVRLAVKDKSYRESELGGRVAEYLHWKENEADAAKSTVLDYEIALAWLALDYSSIPLADFDPPEGTALIRAFMDRHWGSGAPAYPKSRAKAGVRSGQTKTKNLSILSDFFKWGVEQNLLRGDPTIPIRRPKRRGLIRGTYLDGEAERILAATPKARERCAVWVLCEFGLRKNELRLLQLRHYDVGQRVLQIKGKGGRVRALPVVSGEMVRELETHWLSRLLDGSADEYLLYPQKLGPRRGVDGPPQAVNWEDRLAPLSPSAIHNWWKRRLADAGVPHSRKMHEMRHTAATRMLRGSGNLELVRQMLGHASIQTTADIYSHLDVGDLADALRRLDESRRETQ
jgi:integrase